MERTERTVPPGGKALGKAGEGFLTKMAGGLFRLAKSGEAKPVNGLSPLWPSMSRNARVTARDIRALNGYSGNDFKDLNRYYRARAAGWASTDPQLERRGDSVSRALAKLPKQLGTTFRGIRRGSMASELDRYLPGEVVVEHGFTSTSTRPEIMGRLFPDEVVITITGRNGADISDYSPSPQEGEVLYDKGTEFLVTGRRADPDTGQVLITMEEIVR